MMMMITSHSFLTRMFRETSVETNYNIWVGDDAPIEKIVIHIINKDYNTNVQLTIKTNKTIK